MASGYQISSHKYLGYTSASCETEDYTSSRNASSEYPEARCERRHRYKQMNLKTSRRTRTGIRMPGIEHAVANYGNELLEEYSDRSETLDIVHWPALKSTAKNKKSDKKDQSSTKFADASVQADSNDVEQGAYPLWSTTEIVFPFENDTPVYKQNKVSRGNQVDDGMLMNHEQPEICKKPTKVQKSSFKAAKKHQSHKTYADVVQQEGENYGQQFRHPPAETKTFLKIRGLERKQISPIAKDSTEGSSTSSSVKDSDDEKENHSFSFTESLPERFPPTTSETHLLDCNQKTTDVDIPYKEYGDGDSITKGSKKLLYVDDNEDVAEYQKSFNGSYQEEESEGSAQNLVEDSYYTPEQKTMRKMAEKIAIEGFDFETAKKIHHELWGLKKSRMPYTQMFSQSPSNYHRDIIPILSLPDLSHPPINECISRIEFLESPAPFESNRQVFRMYSNEIASNEQHNQIISPNCMSLDIEQMCFDSWWCSYQQVLGKRH